LAASLWDLGRWAAEGRGLLEQLAVTTDPALRLAVAAQAVRHLTIDPVLPAVLLPEAWPGRALRAAYGDYQDELGRMVA
jgi:phenylacetic acid degradation operon negative regulatory protein